MCRPTFLAPEQAPIRERKDLLTLQKLRQTKIQTSRLTSSDSGCREPTAGKCKTWDFSTFDDSSASSTTPATSPPGVCGLETRNLGKCVPDLTCNIYIGACDFLRIIWPTTQYSYRMLSNRRHLCLHYSLSHLPIQWIDTGCMHLDQDFPRFAIWYRHIHELQHAWGTELLISYCMLSTLHVLGGDYAFNVTTGRMLGLAEMSGEPSDIGQELRWRARDFLEVVSMAIKSGLQYERRISSAEV